MAKTKVAKVAFSDAEVEAIRSAARRVWDECGYDVLQAVADDKGKDINRVTVSRAEVIEIALDADRAKDRLRRMSVWTDDFATRYEAASYKELIAVVKPAFAYARYGT